MNICIREWMNDDKNALAEIITPNILKNLRDGTLWPYTVDDADFLSAL